VDETLEIVNKQRIAPKQIRKHKDELILGIQRMEKGRQH